MLPLVLLAASGCGREAGFMPVDSSAVVFWDRQTMETASLLQEMAADFNAGRAGLPIRVERTGGYDDIHRKIIASIRAGVLPGLSVNYPSAVLEYARAGAVVPFDTFLTDPEIGLSAADREDFLPAALEMNRYTDLENGMYSFPFAESVLMMYYNRKLLREAGFVQPPATWDEFLEQCRAIKARTGKQAYAIDVDCSTIDGMIFSRGGDVCAGGTTLYDSPEALAAFELYETISREKLGYQIAGGFDDELAMTQGEVAFAFRSSSGSTYVADVMKDRMEDWGMAVIPQADPEHPVTVLYGPNFVLFNSTPEQQRTAWEFVKFFTSTENCVRWTINTGYLPIRESAAADPRLQEHFETHAYRRTTFACLPFARPEPNIAGWQEVRELTERAVADIIAGRATAREAAARLKQEADALLRARSAR